MKYFHAHSIECSNEDDVLSIRIADDEFDPIDFIILNANHSKNTLELIVNEDDFEFCNVITALILKYDELTIGLNTLCEERLEYNQIVIELKSDTQELKDNLKCIARQFHIKSQIA